jgi:hypothetical protein
MNVREDKLKDFKMGSVISVAVPALEIEKAEFKISYIKALGSYGHLCNEAGGKLIRDVLNDHIKTIFLGHLSKENNLPELAYAAVAAELEGNPFTDDVRDFHLQVANRDTHSALLDI